jgi:hypothetical protein
MCAAIAVLTELIAGALSSNVHQVTVKSLIQLTLDVAMTSRCTVLVYTQYNDIFDVAIIAIILQSIW